MKKVKLSELQKESRERGIPQLAKKLKAEIGYDAVARKVSRNPDEIGAAYKHASRPK
jgi:hypothetical protein